MECQLTCPLGRVRVPGYGPHDAKILICGEAPGRDELRLGRPFVGRAGQLLSTILDEASVDRSSLYITNTTLCVDLTRESIQPTAQEIDTCWPRLQEEIETINPRVIIALGGIAAARWYPGISIGRARGKIRSWDGRYVVSSYHPARGLPHRNPEVVPWIVDDVSLARRLAE